MVPAAQFFSTADPSSLHCLSQPADNRSMFSAAKRFLALLLACGAAATIASAAFSFAQESPAQRQRQTAIALEQAGRNTEAETAWRALLKLQPTSAEAYAHLGFLEAQQQRYVQAIPLYRKALALDPKMPALRMNLGLALFKADQLKEAIRIFEAL